MSNAFNAMGKKQEAYSTLELAVKHCENNWKVWANMMAVSLANKKYKLFY